jgi:hypothetical protein
MNQNVLMLLLIVLGLMVLASISARRDLIRQCLRYLLALFGAGAVTYGIALQFVEPGKALIIAVIAGIVTASQFRPRHSRYIRARDRRKARAEFERFGERYNPRKHEIDHIVPYSRGGGNTADNLKVIARAKNRAKSNRAPWWDIFG